MGARERTLSSETLQTEQRPSKGSTHRQGGVGQDSLEARPIQGAYNGERASLTTLGPDCDSAVMIGKRTPDSSLKYTESPGGGVRMTAMASLAVVRAPWGRSQQSEAEIA